MTTEETEALMISMCNPLGLTTDDLFAAGWEYNGTTWYSKDFGECLSFLEATTCEASRIGLCPDPKAIEALSW